MKIQVIECFSLQTSLLRGSSASRRRARFSSSNARGQKLSSRTTRIPERMAVEHHVKMGEKMQHFLDAMP
jgi:hypothetical protein